LRNVVTGLYSTTNPNVGMGTGDKTITDTRNSWATRSFFARVNYDYKSRYLLELIPQQINEIVQAGHFLAAVLRRGFDHRALDGIHQAVELPHFHKNVIKSFHAGITISFLVQSCTLIPLIFPVSSRK